MLHMDIFRDDAFSAASMTEALEDAEFRPDLLGSLNLFEEIPIATTVASVERRNNMLRLIQTSPRGAPLAEGDRDQRNIRLFPTVRIAKGDTVQASEIQGVRAFGYQDEMQTAIELISRRQDMLLGDVALTQENMMLGAIQGVVLDADGSVIVDWFKEWDMEEPKAINFALDNETTQVERVCREVNRKMIRASKGAFSIGSSIIALCGDNFFDDLTNHKAVRETFLNTAEAQNLNRAFGVATQNALQTGAFATFQYGGITFINYRGVDDYDDKAQSGSKRALGIKPNECRFVPVNARGVFQAAFSPSESFDFVNTLGRPFYSNLILDNDRNSYVRPEVYSYPLYICSRPEMLFRGVSGKK